MLTKRDREPPTESPKPSCILIHLNENRTNHLPESDFQFLAHFHQIVFRSFIITISLFTKNQL